MDLLHRGCVACHRRRDPLRLPFLSPLGVRAFRHEDARAPINHNLKRGDVVVVNGREAVFLYRRDDTAYLATTAR